MLMLAMAFVSLEGQGEFGLPLRPMGIDGHVTYRTVVSQPGNTDSYLVVGRAWDGSQFKGLVSSVLASGGWKNADFARNALGWYPGEKLIDFAGAGLDNLCNAGVYAGDGYIVACRSMKANGFYDVYLIKYDTAGNRVTGFGTNGIVTTGIGGDNTQGHAFVRGVTYNPEVNTSNSGVVTIVGAVGNSGATYKPFIASFDQTSGAAWGSVVTLNDYNGTAVDVIYDSATSDAYYVAATDNYSPKHFYVHKFTYASPSATSLDEAAAPWGEAVDFSTAGGGNESVPSGLALGATGAWGVEILVAGANKTDASTPPWNCAVVAIESSSGDLRDGWGITSVSGGIDDQGITLLSHDGSNDCILNSAVRAGTDELVFVGAAYTSSNGNYDQLVLKLDDAGDLVTGFGSSGFKILSAGPANDVSNGAIVIGTSVFTAGRVDDDNLYQGGDVQSFDLATGEVAPTVVSLSAVPTGPVTVGGTPDVVVTATLSDDSQVTVPLTSLFFATSDTDKLEAGAGFVTAKETPGEATVTVVLNNLTADFNIEVASIGCAEDDDEDGYCNDGDNCPYDPNDQSDADTDGIGDVCDSCPANPDSGLDSDSDGIDDSCDNCASNSNSDQADGDTDGVGDACDACPEAINYGDTDGDSVDDVCDSCPWNFDLFDDSDGDGIDAACDNCPEVNDPSNDPMQCEVCDDTDGDGVCNDSDNCLETSNADQADSDSDGTGDACESGYFPTGEVLHLDAARADGSSYYANGCTDTTWVDLSSEGNSAVLNGFASCDSSSGWVDGGMALAFDGVDDTLTTNDIGLAGEFVLAFWMKTPSSTPSGAWQTVACLTDNLNSLYIYPGTRHLYIENVGSFSDYDVADGEWHHIALVRDSSDALTLYVDANPDSFVPNRAGELFLRGFGDSMSSVNEFYAGKLDEILLYVGSYSQSDVLALYNAQASKYPAAEDSDGDGVSDAGDNCPETYNTEQTDGDADGIGDDCDNCPADYDPSNDPGTCACSDGDGDGVCDDSDNCPSVANSDQADIDSDGRGDACDSCAEMYDPFAEDSDGDGIGDACDNCPGTSNWGIDADYDTIDDACDPCVGGTGDSDGDSIEDECDTCPFNWDPGNDPNTCACSDTDGDGLCDESDNCPVDYNSEQTDSDWDGVGDTCDTCPNHYDPSNSSSTCDADGDAFPDDIDNCPSDYNPDQQDMDWDGMGDACDFE